MIEKIFFDPVIQFKMAKLINGKPLYTMACYYVDGLLIDTGPVHVADEIEEAFKGLNIDVVVNTHHHEDHIGNNIVFQNKWRINAALVHSNAVERIKNPEIWIKRLRAYQHVVWGSPPPSNAQVIGESIKTSHYEFKVIYTPGHSDDHICLLESERGWLFSGDLFIKEDLKVLRSDENFHELLASLYELTKYNFDTIFCSSGQVVKEGKKALMRKIEYFEKLKEQILDLYSKGMEIEEIRRQVLGEESALFIPTGGDFSKINLVKSVLNIK